MPVKGIVSAGMAILAVSVGLVVGRSSPVSTPIPTPSGRVLGITITPRPSATPEATDRPATPSPSPAPSPGASASPGPTAAPAAVSAPRAQPTPTPRPAGPEPQRPSFIDCGGSPHLCSSTSEGMTLRDGRLRDRTSSTRQRPSDVPEFTMVSAVLRPSGQHAGVGDEVSTVKVDVRIANRTNRTFVFPDGEITLRWTRGDQDFPRSARQGRFEMTPGAELIATFEVPVVHDGAYSWDAVSWYYAR